MEQHPGSKARSRLRRNKTEITHGIGYKISGDGEEAPEGKQKNLKPVKKT